MVLKLILSIVGISAGFIAIVAILGAVIKSLRVKNKALKETISGLERELAEVKAQASQAVATAGAMEKINKQEDTNVKKIKNSNKSELVDSASNMFP